MNPWVAYGLGFVTPAIAFGVLYFAAAALDWLGENIVISMRCKRGTEGQRWLWVRWWRPAVVVKLRGRKRFVALGWFVRSQGPDSWWRKWGFDA